MFELIRANRRKSAGLIAIMGSVLLGAGFAVGYLLAPEEPAVWGLCMLLAAAVWLVMLLTSLAGGERILLNSARAREVQRADAPQLFNIVEEMCIASGLSVVPKVYLIDTPDPNAFAVGLKPERAAVAVTTGLMAKLNRDELQNVVAHELAHIQNRDTLFITLAGVTVGAIILLGEFFWRSMLFGGRGRSSRGGGRGGNNQGAAVLMIAAVALAILAPILARLLYFACSRRREYLADACAAQYTRYPEGLASALEKISHQAAQRTEKAETSKVLAPMYIVNPLAARSRRTGWFSTHPATEDRVRVLRGMTGSASLAAYEQAYRAQHPKESVLTPSLLKQSVEQPARAAATGDPAGDAPNTWREAQDLLHKIDRYAMLACACGMKLKVPPDFDQSQVACPKCGQVHPVPPEMLAALAAVKTVAS
jgi:heat shock protein HtpX